ncbi:TetR/AcrR family transcriptional regulator [Nocardia sp. NPDC058379]|uniref:TetR/AcrR family transcriptional regulator n=1 Tax=unclassified Nocardia TaxID=2637762 RepID=UPI003647F24B
MLRIVVEQGAHWVTMNRVARAVGVSRPVIYRAFATTDDMLTASLEREHRAVLAELLPSLFILQPPKDTHPGGRGHRDHRTRRIHTAVGSLPHTADRAGSLLSPAHCHVRSHNDRRPRRQPAKSRRTADGRIDEGPRRRRRTSSGFRRTTKCG